MTEQRAELGAVFAQLSKQLEITNINPLGWENDPAATIGELIGWRKETIWVRSICAEEKTSSGVTRVASLQFTSDREQRFDQYNCSFICTLDGTEVIQGKKQMFTFEILPQGCRQHILITPNADFLVIGKIIIIFHSVWGTFKLGDITQPS